MTVEDDQRRSIQEIAGQLVPVAFFAKGAFYLKGSLSGDTSPREGGRSAHQSLPGWDKVDRGIRKRQKRYRECLREAEKLMREAAAIESWMLEAVDDVKADPKCGNADCGQFVTDGKHSLCGRCRTWLSRNGVLWPLKREEVRA